MATNVMAPESHSPAHAAFSITPDDNNDLLRPTRGLYVGVAGNVKVDFIGGGTETLTNLAAGIAHPFAVRRVYSTGTSATSILGLY